MCTTVVPELPAFPILKENREVLFYGKQIFEYHRKI